MLLNKIEHLLNLVSTITGCVSISAFGFKICAMTTGTKRKKVTKLIITRKKKHDKIFFVGKR